MATCPECNRNLPERARQCPHCGADVTWWLSRDGEVYGPYDERTVRYIVRDHRAELDDPAMIGREGTWRPLGELLESTSAGAPKAAIPSQPEDAQKEDPYRRWSFGRWLLFIGIVLVASVVVGGAIVWPTYQNLARGDEQARSRAHLKQIHLALDLYAHENEGKLPPADQWEETIESFIGSQRARTPGGKSYWFNEDIGGEKVADLAKAEEPPILAAEPGALKSARADKEYLCLRADGTIAHETAERIKAPASEAYRRSFSWILRRISVVEAPSIPDSSTISAP